MLFTFKMLIFIEALQVSAIAMFFAALNIQSRKLLTISDLLIVLLIPVVGLFGHEKNVFYAFLAFIPLLSIGNPQKLVQRYLMILPLFPALQAPYQLGSLYITDLSAIDAFNLGTILALLLTPGSRKRSNVAIDASVWLFLFVHLAMLARGERIDQILRASITSFLAIIPAYYVLTRAITSRKAADDANVFLVLGAFINAVVALFEVRKTWPLYDAFHDSLHLQNFMLSASISIRAGMQRAQGAMANPASLGLLCALAILSAYTLTGRFRPLGKWFVIALLILALMGSQSRGAWIAVVAGIAFFQLYERKLANLAAFSAIAAAGWVLIANFFTADSRIGQLVGRSGHAASTIDYRKTLFTRGLQEISKHPMFGQTRAQLEVSMNDLRQGEHIVDFVNTHLFAALSCGLVGFALWMVAWCTPLFVGLQARGYRLSTQSAPFVAMPFAMIVACFTCLTFTSMIDRVVPLSMLSVGMLSAFVTVTRRGDIEQKPFRGPKKILVARLECDEGESSDVVHAKPHSPQPFA